MAFRKLTLVLPVAALLVGCQSSQKSAREQQLEQRVQELEQQLGSPSPEASPAAAAQASDAPAARTAPVPVERSRKPAASTPARTGSSGGGAESQPAGSDRVERIPSAEPAGEDAGAQTHEAVEPRPTRLVLPEGTELTLLLETALSSATSREGDAVVARVERAVSEDGRIVLPGGTVLRGRVTEARPSGRVKGRARVAVDFDRIVVRGVTHELDASPIAAEAPGEGGRDAKMVGGGAAAGAVLGAIIDGKKGAVRGAVVGAGAGGAAVLLTKGHEVELPAGSRWTVRVRGAVRL